jgi:hypothetical protein
MWWGTEAANAPPLSKCRRVPESCCGDAHPRMLLQVFAPVMSSQRLCDLRLANPVLDFEVCTAYNVTVVVSDGWLEAVASVIVSISDVADAPSVTWVTVSAAAGVLTALEPLVVPSSPFATAPSGLGSPVGSWPPVPLSPTGGSVVVIQGTSVGCPAAGGFLAVRAPGVSLAYWNAAASTPVILNSTSCVVVAGASGGLGEVQCVTVPGAGNITAVRLSVYGQLSPVFTVQLRHAAPVVTSVRDFA